MRDELSSNYPRFEGSAEQQRDSLLPLAELLREEVQSRIYNPDFPGTETIDQAFSGAFQAVAEKIIDAELAVMNPVDFAHLYVKYVGSAALSDHLDKWQALQMQALSRKVWLEQIAQEANAHGRLVLADMPAEEVVEIGLFDKQHLDSASYRHRDDQATRPLHRVITVRLLEPTTGAAEVVNDTWHGAVWSENVRPSELLKPHERIQLGTNLPAGEAEPQLSPNIDLHSSIAYVLPAGDAAVHLDDQVVGYVRLREGTLLLDGENKSAEG